MKAKNLIKYLSDLDPETEIIVATPGSRGSYYQDLHSFEYVQAEPVKGSK